jgi:hypothetical protein
MNVRKFLTISIILASSPPSNAEVKECVELYLHSLNTPSWRGAQLKHRDSFTFCSILILRGPFAKFMDSWRCGDGLFFEVHPSASDVLLTTLHPLLENGVTVVLKIIFRMVVHP